jgi:hypothetical protein
MRTLSLSLIFAIISIAFSGSVEIGGQIPIKNNVICDGNVCIDMSESVQNLQEIARMTINNNTQSWELSIKFKNGGRFRNEATGAEVVPTNLIFTQGNSGFLGRGLSPLINYDLRPYINGGGNESYTWKPGIQSSATVDYVMLIEANWDASNALAGLYTETITAVITARF